MILSPMNDRTDENAQRDKNSVNRRGGGLRGHEDRDPTKQSLWEKIPLISTIVKKHRGNDDKGQNSGNGDNGGSKRRNKKFPPEPSWLRWLGIGLASIFIPVGLLFAVDQLFFRTPLFLPFLPSHTFWAYAGFVIGLFALFLERYLRHEISIHNARLEDQSEVDTLMSEAQTVQPRSTDPVKPDDYEQKKQDLGDEVKRLIKLGTKGWTQYQVLYLNQMLVSFLKIDDLKSCALLNLSYLEDYAVDSAYRYDRDYYDKWKERIDKAISKISEDEDSPLNQDASAESLRAELRSLLEYLTGVEANWAEGSAVVRVLMICGAVAIPVLLVMGLVPYLHPVGDKTLGILNWGLLATSGSLTAVLLALHKSDLVEVGNTEGKKELWRAVLGAALGFVAGILIYSIIWGGLLPESTVPKFKVGDLKDLGLSILWAIGSGFSFEKVLDRMRSTLEQKT